MKGDNKNKTKEKEERSIDSKGDRLCLNVEKEIEFPYDEACNLRICHWKNEKWHHHHPNALRM